jgi:hypothetical protein
MVRIRIAGGLGPRGSGSKTTTERQEVVMAMGFPS